MKLSLDTQNEAQYYLDEKELFILYTLLRERHISTMWGSAFTPNKMSTIIVPKDPADFDAAINRSLQNIQSKSQSSIVLSYLLDLGKELDEEGFSVSCNADYALVEGGFLCEYVGKLNEEYIADTQENRKSLEKYAVLNKEQKDFFEEVIENGDFDQTRFSKLQHPPILEYQEAVLNKKADQDFIDLVNKLVTEYAGGGWDTSDAIKFLEIYYRHNKKEFGQNIASRRSFLEEDPQTKLAKLIFENIDIRLSIKNTEKLGSYLLKYISQFKNDKLNGRSKSGLTATLFSEGLSIPLHTKLFGFKKQRDILLRHIEEKYSEYQRNDLEIGHPHFEPEYIGDMRSDDVKITLHEKKDEEDLFLFVHTMIALAQEKYLEIVDFSCGSTGIFDLYDRGFLFKVLLKNAAEESTEQASLEGFDEKHHLLKFAGKEIELSKKGKETDAVLLMRTLLTAKNDEWKHNDEILSDWGLTDEDMKKVPKNKVYFAGQKINNAVALKTQIADFIECNTSKARINPKYRKVDE